MSLADLTPARQSGRQWPGFAWMAALYAATAVTATITFPMAPPLLEARNIAAHTVSYAVQAALIAWAAGSPPRLLGHGEAWVVLATVLALGIGQEVLQTVVRAQAYPLNSLFDLGVDVSGAALGLWVVRRRIRSADRT